MKKVILMLVLALLILFNNRAFAKESIPPDGIKVTITIDIGRPITCLIYWAVCKVDIGYGNMAATAELLQASDGKLSGGDGGGSWLINIPRDNFAKYYPGYLSKLDGQNSVTFDDSYTLPANVKKALGSSRDLVIKSNVAYPLKYENGVFTITFPQ